MVDSLHGRTVGPESSHPIMDTVTNSPSSCRRVSVLHGRPASIAPTEVDAELPKDLAEFRQSDNVSKFSNMSALIDMTLRLGDASNAM